MAMGGFIIVRNLPKAHTVQYGTFPKMEILVQSLQTSLMGFCGFWCPKPEWLGIFEKCWPQIYASFVEIFKCQMTAFSWETSECFIYNYLGMMKFAGFRDSHGMLLSKEASEACLHIVCVFLLWLLWAHLWTYGSSWLGMLCGRKHSSVICLLTKFEIFRKFADDRCCRLLSCRNSCLVKFWTLLSCIQCHEHRFRVCFYTKKFSSWKDTLFLKCLLIWLAYFTLICQSFFFSSSLSFLLWCCSYRLCVPSCLVSESSQYFWTCGRNSTQLVISYYQSGRAVDRWQSQWEC